MANKRFLAGMLAAALTFGLVFLGCENGVQEVEGAVNISKPQVAAPEISEAKTTDGKYVILSWRAVADANAYLVFTNQKDKTAINGISGISATNQTTYKTDGTTPVNSDSDLWNVRIPLTAQFGAVLQEYRFGIQARAGGYDGRDWFPASGITWGAYYQQTAHPYTVLLGNWSKEGATAAEKQKFSFTSSGDSDNPINYVISDQTGVFLDGGSLSSSAIWGGTVSFSIYINGYSSVQIYMTGDGKLQVSTSGSSYSYLDGPYTK